MTPERERLVAAYDEARDRLCTGLIGESMQKDATAYDAARAALLAAMEPVGEVYEVIHSFGIPFVRLPLSYKPGDTVRVSKVNTT